MAITTRTAKGSALSWTELDTNFTELSTRGIGYGQTWTDMLLPTVQRAVNVPYTNNTGKPITVSVTADGTDISMIVSGITMYGTTGYNAGGYYSSITVIVPPTVIYKVAAGSSIKYWSELV